MSEASPTTSIGPLLHATNLSKTFGRVKVLHDAELLVPPGQIHGLVGANGSGKSTIIKILAGYHAPDPGAALVVRGEGIGLPLTAAEPRRLGIGFVHQDLGLADSMSVLENLHVGRFAVRAGGRIDWSRERDVAGQELERMGIDLPLDAMVSSLSSVQRALVAIARALGAAHGDRPGIVFLDEPTAYLPQDGLEILYETLRRLAGQGHGIVLVSHNLAEVLELADGLTVLREGRVVGKLNSKDTDVDSLAELMLGRSGLTTKRSTTDVPLDEFSSAPVLMQVTGLSGRGIGGADLTVRAGEVVGMTGLLGSGFDEVPYLLFGARPAESGSLNVDGRAFDLSSMTPEKAIRAGIALLPANRVKDSGVQDATATENVTVLTLTKYFRRGWLHTREETSRTLELMNEYDVRPKRPSGKLSSYSGGNQQKMLVSKWVEAGPRMMLLHEPGQGVDLGARVDIFARLRKLAAEEGVGMLVASSEYADLVGLCDRVLIWRRGRVIDEVRQSDLSEEVLAQRCLV